jgi:hypothetical protein
MLSVFGRDIRCKARNTDVAEYRVSVSLENMESGADEALEGGC